MLRSLILDNLWLKSFSLILAILIWVAIQSNQSDNKFSLFPPRPHTAEFPCPVRVLLSPASRSLFNVEPASVMVKVYGDDAVLKKLAAQSIQAYVRPADQPNLDYLFRVEVVVPRDVTIKEIIPEHVSVRLINSTNK